MNTKYYILLILILTMSFSFAYATSTESVWGFGLEGGVALGDNAVSEEIWVPTGRGFIQANLSKVFQTQLGVSFLPVKAENSYYTKSLMGDFRLIFMPFNNDVLSPFIYTGIGVSKDMKNGDSDFCPVVPIGFGVQTKPDSKFAINLHADYNISSDKFDGIMRQDGDLNRITNKKHDGFFTVMLGFVISNPFAKKAVVVEAPVIVEEVKPKDTDGDGINDDVELSTYKTDPNKADTDGDGLSDGLEALRYKTDPLKADTDGDGLSDGAEVNQYKTDPTKIDTDGDGLNDYAEINVYNTNPLNIDTDGGGLNDGAEIKAGKNPLDPKDDVDKPVIEKKPEPVVVPPPKPDMSLIDTDGDGLKDIDETQKYRTDPNKKDTDGDGLSDGEEILTYRTDPLLADTDRDGLNDGLEVNQYKTDPNKADTDGDGLNDYAEIMTYRTDPLKIDTDGAGMNDGAEVKAGKNPLDPKDDLLDMTKGKKVVLDGIMFASGNAKIVGSSETILTKVYESLVANPDVDVLIIGHTDSVGNEDSNRELSTKRAQAVKDWLVEKGISSSRIKVVGKGEAEPIASNETSDGRAKNRRIEFEVQN